MYLVPGYIIPPLGYLGQAKFHMLFEQKSSFLPWNDLPLYAPSGERNTKVTIMGMDEREVAYRKAAFEDPPRGRVQSNEEGGKW